MAIMQYVLMTTSNANVIRIGKYLIDLWTALPFYSASSGMRKGSICQEKGYIGVILTLQKPSKLISN
jgi:hypothetical protein